MKKKLLVLGIALVMAMSLAVLSACGGSMADPNVGVYKIDTLLGMSAEEWSELAGQDVTETFVIELKDDGTALFTVDGEEENLKWEVDGTTFKLSDDSGEGIEGTIEDGVITIEEDDLAMTFKKAE